MIYSMKNVVNKHNQKNIKLASKMVIWEILFFGLGSWKELSKVQLFTLQQYL